MKYYKFLVLISLLFYSCGENASSQINLKPISKVKLRIAEPSGITYFRNGLYIISDRKYFIYKTDLQGKIIDKIATNLTSSEGITVNNNGDFFVINEAKRTFIKLDSTGSILQETKINGKQKEINSGLEGVCYNSRDNNFYVLNEKSPKELLIINEEGVILKTIKIAFAKDLSGICFDAETGNFWLISDESEAIFSINSKGELLQKYKIPVKKPEGIVLVNDKIYVVSDGLGSLFTFEKPN